MATVALVPAAQVVRHAFFPPPPPTPAAAYPSCREGLAALYEAVVHARDAAREGMEHAIGEELAVERFRAAVAPAWQRRDEVARLCGSNGSDRRALDTIERLRYAEEHAVRKQAAELQLLRRRARDVVGIDR